MYSIYTYLYSKQELNLPSCFTVLYHEEFKLQLNNATDNELQKEPEKCFPERFILFVVIWCVPGAVSSPFTDSFICQQLLHFLWAHKKKNQFFLSLHIDSFEYWIIYFATFLRRTQYFTLLCLNIWIQVCCVLVCGHLFKIMQHVSTNWKMRVLKLDFGTWAKSRSGNKTGPTQFMIQGSFICHLTQWNPGCSHKKTMSIILSYQLILLDLVLHVPKQMFLHLLQYCTTCLHYSLYM